MNMPALGAIPSAPDYRDLYVAGAMADIEPAVGLPASFSTDLPGLVLDQKKTPSCVAHAWVVLMKLYWFRKTGEVVDFSPRFLDTLVKRFDGLDAIRATAGAQPRLVAKAAVEYGCATVHTVPNDTALLTLEYRDDRILTDAAMEEAAKYKIPGYVRVGIEKEALRFGTYLYGGVSILMQIGSEWWTPSWASRDVNPLRTPRSIVSGHEVVVRGWDDEVYDQLRNSWSNAWNSNGNGKFNAGQWAPYLVEAWAIAQVPQKILDFLKHLPAPTDFQYKFEKNARRGDHGEEVKFVQIALMILGHLRPVPADELGMYGGKTATAVEKFQIAHGIRPQSGNDVGPLTRQQLNAIFWR